MTFLAEQHLAAAKLARPIHEAALVLAADVYPGIMHA